MLPGLCQSWDGVLSAALYVPILATAEPTEASANLEKAHGAIAAVFAEAEAMASTQGCQMDVTLYSEVVANATVAALFPVNALRNAALLAASTELVMLGDADLLVGSSMNAALQDTARYSKIYELAQSGRVVVVPAFQSDTVEKAFRVAKIGKSAAAQMWKDKAIQYFEEGYEPLHGPTNFTRWTTATAPYDLTHADTGYEPWWIAARLQLAPFDVRYRGFGKNKVQQLQTQLVALKSGFVVHHEGFLIHRPHKESEAKAQFKADMSNGSSASKLPRTDIFKVTEQWFGQQLALGDKVKVLVAPEWLACAAELSWWHQDAKKGFPVSLVTEVGSQPLSSET